MVPHCADNLKTCRQSRSVTAYLIIIIVVYSHNRGETTLNQLIRS